MPRTQPALRSAPDAVDGSSTGTQVPWMWVLLMHPRFGGAQSCKRPQLGIHLGSGSETLTGTLGEIMQQLGLEASALADRPVGPFGSADHGCAGKTVSQPTSASDELKALVNALPA
jgi:hypothetical protein